jgi:hypothetical protein
MPRCGCHEGMKYGMRLVLVLTAGVRKCKVQIQVLKENNKDNSGTTGM